MEDSRQDLRTEFRAATESSGLAGFGLASVRKEDGGWRAERLGTTTVSCRAAFIRHGGLSTHQPICQSALDALQSIRRDLADGPEKHALFRDRQSADANQACCLESAR